MPRSGVWVQAGPQLSPESSGWGRGCPWVWGGGWAPSGENRGIEVPAGFVGSVATAQTWGFFFPGS